MIDAVTREVEAVLLTGGGSHMAAVTPDDSAVWVAAIGAEQLVEIPLDLDADATSFAIGETLDVGVRTITGDERLVTAAPPSSVGVFAFSCHLT